ncbi:MAG: DUF4465 domain-containing protein [Burkholderiales bacterium]
MKHSLGLLACATLLTAAAAHAAPVVSTFEALPLPADSAFEPGVTTSFVSGAARFDHRFTDFGGGCCWEGWTYSNRTDTTTGGFGNQYSAFAGAGANGSTHYGIAFFGNPVVTFDEPVQVLSADLTNTTYAALSMRDGDGFAKKFGGATGDDADFLKLTIIGRDPAGAMTGSVDVYLADYRFADNTRDYILSAWHHTDLRSLGVVSSLAFAMSSSDNGVFGMNTPSYFALDDLTVTAVPEPASAGMLAAGLTVLALLALRPRRSDRRR